MGLGCRNSGSALRIAWRQRTLLSNVRCFLRWRDLTEAQSTFDRLNVSGGKGRHAEPVSQVGWGVARVKG